MKAKDKPLPSIPGTTVADCEITHRLAIPGTRRRSPPAYMGHSRRQAPESRAAYRNRVEAWREVQCRAWAEARGVPLLAVGIAQ